MSELSHDSGAARNGIGVRLQVARERANLSLVQAAERLHVDPNVIDALETERFGELGASVYIRGHLRHYAELVKESAPELLASYADTVVTGPAPDLTQMPHAKQDSSARSALVVGGLAVVIGVGLVGCFHWIYLDLHPAAAAAAAVALASAPVVERPAAAAPPVAASPAAAPQAVAPAVTAASAPRPIVSLPRVRKSVHAAVAEAAVTLMFKSACWTEVYDARGKQLYHGIGVAGDVADLRGAAPLRVVIGNLAVVDIEIDGHAQQIPAQDRSGGSAEFLVTQTGALQPVHTETTAGNKP